jgi:hypothetical protein
MTLKTLGPICVRSIFISRFASPGRNLPLAEVGREEAERERPGGKGVEAGG